MTNRNFYWYLIIYKQFYKKLNYINDSGTNKKISLYKSAQMFDTKFVRFERGRGAEFTQVF